MPIDLVVKLRSFIYLSLEFLKCSSLFSLLVQCHDLSSISLFFQPIFHDGIKEWSCCKKRSHDFSLFLEIKG